MIKSLEDVKKEFYLNGITIRAWAKLHNYHYHTVRHVLSGQSKYSRGQSHEIAILLKLKEGELSR